MPFIPARTDDPALIALTLKMWDRACERAGLPLDSPEYTACGQSAADWLDQVAAFGDDGPGFTDSASMEHFILNWMSEHHVEPSGKPPRPL